MLAEISKGEQEEEEVGLLAQKAKEENSSPACNQFKSS